MAEKHKERGEDIRLVREKTEKQEKSVTFFTLMEER
ncbi:hypothetical protein Xmir_03095 [Xenorhabdus miraniensis]|uniref:Uncharacterized protein n=1 Tax=Xenorhabdus miraniensis TaxID=351674 RepID=A0A2D0JMQ2_9GAMM|nr:hypothetical protein Xmir_03095 [Xenorhabdus miraniensis]